MIKRHLLHLLLMVGLLPAQAQTEQLVIQAQDAYAKGAYGEALALYDSVGREMSSASLYFNIGNCHMKLGDVPSAILNYERAIRLQPGSEDIQSNLDLARTQVVDRVNQLPAFTLGSVWDRVRGGKDVDQWARRSLWACFLLFVLAIAFVLVRRQAIKRVVLIAVAICAVIMITAMVLAGYRLAEVNDRSQAIIMMPKVDVLAEPRIGATPVFVLHEGTKVSVLQEQNGWYEVKLSSGSVGWAASASLVII
jgi:tetratricopeptide (TPR) repeat protein